MFQPLEIEVVRTFLDDPDRLLYELPLLNAKESADDMSQMLLEGAPAKVTGESGSLHTLSWEPCRA